jgi:hypothetical protein
LSRRKVRSAGRPSVRRRISRAARRRRTQSACRWCRGGRRITWSTPSSRSRS